MDYLLMEFLAEKQHTYLSSTVDKCSISKTNLQILRTCMKPRGFTRSNHLPCLVTVREYKSL